MDLVLARRPAGPLVMELTGRDRSFVLPLLIAVVAATVVARSLDPRSIYDVRFTPREMDALEKQRRPSPN